MTIIDPKKACIMFLLSTLCFTDFYIILIVITYFAFSQMFVKSQFAKPFQSVS